MDWLQPVREALDGHHGLLTFFYRDDDAGWANEALRELIGHFSALGLPLDLAVIPAVVTPKFAEELQEQIAQATNPIRIHQHGYAHLNYEISGRKYEFGDRRSEEKLLDDIRRGQEKLANSFSTCIDPIFTPPWNRCNQATIQVLIQLSFKALSRDVGAELLNTQELQEIPIHINWLKRSKGIRLNRADIAQSIADCILNRPRIGIMLHHAEMMTDDWNNFTELVGLLQQNPSIEHKNMRALMA